MINKQNLLSYFNLALAQSAIAINVLAGKYLLDKSMPIWLFIGGRFFCSSVMLILATLLVKQPLQIEPKQGKVGFKMWTLLFLQALTGGFLFNVLFMEGIVYTTATDASIIGSTLPALIAISAFFFLGEKFTKTKIAALILAMVGILIINLDNLQPLEPSNGSLWGNFLVFLAMVPEALYSIVSKFVGRKINALAGAMVVNCLCFLMFLPLMLYALQGQDLTQYLPFDWFLIFAGGASTAIFYWCWSLGLITIPASIAALFSGFTPIATSLGAFFWLDEKFGLYDAVGLLLVILSIVIGARGGKSFLGSLFRFRFAKTISEVSSTE